VRKRHFNQDSEGKFREERYVTGNERGTLNYLSRSEPLRTLLSDHAGDMSRGEKGLKTTSGNGRLTWSEGKAKWCDEKHTYPLRIRIECGGSLWEHQRAR